MLFTNPGYTPCTYTIPSSEAKNETYCVKYSNFFTNLSLYLASMEDL